SGVASVADTVNESAFSFAGTAGDDAFSLTDGTVISAEQTTRINTATAPSVEIDHKAALVINGAGGNDTVDFNNPGTAAGLSSLHLTDVDAVTQGGAINVANLSLQVDGPVTLNGHNDVDTLAAQVQGAGNAFSFNDVDDITIGSVVGIDGISTTNGNVTVTTENGPVTVTNTGAASDVDAGTGSVTLTAGSTGTADQALTLDARSAVRGLSGGTLPAAHT